MPVGAALDAHEASTTSADQWRAALEFYETEKRLQYEQTKFLLEQSRTYHTVVMGLAYGGFFAIWSAARSITGENGLLAVSGAAMLLSISTFVLFTILNMYLLSKMTVKNAKIANAYDQTPNSPTELQATTKLITSQREAANAEIRHASARVALLWPWFFYPSLLSGVVGMLILLFVYMRHVW